MLRYLRPWLKLIVFVFVLVYHFIWLTLSMAAIRKDPAVAFRIRRSFCKGALKAFNIRVITKGDRELRHGLYVSNHRSMLDPLIQLSFMDAYILSKAEVGDYPLIGKGARETGVLFVDRTNDNSRKAALQSIERFLKEGKPILIYPEGTTHVGPLTGSFRKGAFEVAFHNAIPVIPVMIEYADPSYYWSEESLMKYFIRIFSKPGRHMVTVEKGDVIAAQAAENLLLTAKESIDAMIATHHRLA